VVRAGRRAGKSSTFSRLGVVEAIYGQHDVPPGDLGTVGVVSTRRDEAAKRLRTITAILDVLGEKYRPLPGGAIGVELVGRRRAFQVFAASIAGVSGFTGIFILCDEVAKWLDSDTGANPATEVLASVRPTMATQPNARIALSSSPMGRLDAHFDAFEEGDNALQTVDWFSTWEANPTLTEQDTRALEPDESTWLREYKAIPQSEAESALLAETLIDAAVRRPPMLWDLPPMPGHAYVATIDPATRGNAFTLIVATRGPDLVRRIALAREWRGSPSSPLRLDEVFAQIALLVRPYGITHVHTDQFAADALTEIAWRSKLGLVVEPWSMTTKREAYEELRTITLARQFECHPDPQVASDLLGIRKVLTRVGVSYELAEHGGRHSDYAPAVAMAVSDARLAAAREPVQATVQEKADAAKVTFLRQRERERKQAEKRGPVPVTHRRRMFGG
jgi:hypothetical protein